MQPGVWGGREREAERVTRAVAQLGGEGAVRREQVRRRPAAVLVHGRQHGEGRVKVLDELILRSRGAKGEEERRGDGNRLALRRVVAQLAHQPLELLGRLGGERLAAQDERIHRDHTEPIGTRARSARVVGCGDESLEELDARGRSHHACVHQLHHEPCQPANAHRRVVVESALQLLLRTLHDVTPDVRVGNVEQARKRAIDARLGVQ